MNTPQWERAKDLFDAALDLPPDARPAFLRRSCGDDTGLLNEVEALLAADAAAGSFLDPVWLAPFAPAPVPIAQFELQPGDVVSGRFKIIRPLGDGGMGRVYEAHDVVLGVRIALKTLRPEISSNPEVLFRFRQEVRIAHRITHPNVCRTFHLDHELRRSGDDESSSVDLTFLTMEYLEGETLRQLLKRTGRLSCARALRIARQMAEAIGAAHQIGVIHRDIKPGNVMICASSPLAAVQEERVVVTDFGLAKFEASAPNNDITSISQPGRAMGTLSYMSPEQLQGAEVGPASDLYAFGLVLYEMVTGAKAFPDSGTMGAAYRRITEPPPSPRAIVPDLPMAWESAILGCLRAAPAARFQNAAEVLGVLNGSVSPLSAQLTPPWHAMWWRRSRVAIGVAVIGAVALFVLALRLFSARPDPIVAPGTLVYLAPVRNETGEKRLDNVTQLVQAGLEQSAHIDLLDASRVGDLLQQMTRPVDAPIDASSAREIALRANAGRVIFTTLSAVSGSYRLDVEIQRPDASSIARYRNHWHRAFTWQSAAPASSDAIAPEMLAQVRDASSWIRSAVGESGGDIERLDAPPEDVTTDSWTALSAYSSAERFYSTGQTENAIVELQKATAADPHFALAYARMGDIATSLGRIEEGYRDYEYALNTNFDRRLTRRELDRIRGVYASDSWDYQTAETTFRDYTVFYPNDYTGWFCRGLPLARLNRLAEANAVLERAYAINPLRPQAPHDLSIFGVMGNNLPVAERWIGVLDNLHRTEAANQMRGIVAMVTNRFDQAPGFFTQITTSQTPSLRQRGYALLARLAAERGDAAQAIKWTDAGIGESTAQGNHSRTALFLIDRALLDADLGRDEEAMADAQKALALDDSPPMVIATAQLVGSLLPRLPPRLAVPAKQLLMRLEANLHPNPNRVSAQLAAAIVHVEVLLAGGNWQQALVEARRASAMDSQYVQKPSLVRALRSAAAHAGEADRGKLLNEARDLLGRTALHPYVLWSELGANSPGAEAHDLKEFIEISKQISRDDGDVARAIQSLAKLRSPSLSQTH